MGSRDRARPSPRMPRHCRVGARHLPERALACGRQREVVGGTCTGVQGRVRHDDVENAGVSTSTCHRTLTSRTPTVPVPALPRYGSSVAVRRIAQPAPRWFLPRAMAPRCWRPLRTPACRRRWCRGGRRDRCLALSSVCPLSSWAVGITEAQGHGRRTPVHAEGGSSVRDLGRNHDDLRRARHGSRVGTRPASGQRSRVRRSCRRW